MIYLFLCILFSTSLIAIIKLFDRLKIDTFQGIVFNYLFCALTGLLMIPDKHIFMEMQGWPGLPYCIFLGIAFVLNFLLLGVTITRMGITVASVAQKIGFVIPVVAAIYLYHEPLTIFKVIAVALALLSVFFISMQGKEQDDAKKSPFLWLLPGIIFIGCGACDAGFNYIQRSFYVEAFQHSMTVLVFFCAFLAGIIIFIIQLVRKKIVFKPINLLGGLMLGVPNYFSLYFLLQALEKSGMESSSLFPFNNICIVGLSALTGYLVFKEPFSKYKIIGLSMALASILVTWFLT